MNPGVSPPKRVGSFRPTQGNGQLKAGKWRGTSKDERLRGKHTPQFANSPGIDQIESGKNKQTSVAVERKG